MCTISVTQEIHYVFCISIGDLCASDGDQARWRNTHLCSPFVRVHHYAQTSINLEYPRRVSHLGVCIVVSLCLSHRTAKPQKRTPRKYLVHTLAQHCGG